MTQVLAEILERYERMPEAGKAEFVKLVHEGTKHLKFVPNPGPQVDGYLSKADVLLFGGSPGSGKSFLGLGLALNCHERALIMRRQYTDLDFLIEEAIKINGTRDGYSGKPPPSLTHSKGRIDFGAASHIGDEQRWMGRPHDLLCVGRGTLVRMADGSHKPIEQLRTGDMVDTLNGGRRVTRVYPPQRKNAVRISVYDGLRLIASQVQSENHELLTSAGWVAHGNADVFPRVAFFGPTRFDVFCISSLLFCRSSAQFLRQLVLRFACLLRSVGRSLDVLRLAYPHRPGIFSCAVPPSLESVFAGSYGLSQQTRPHCELTWSGVLLSQPLWMVCAVRNIQDFFFSCAKNDAPTSSLFRDSLGRCSSDSHPCDGRILVDASLDSELADDQALLRRPGDAVRPIPIDFAVDESVRIPKRSGHKELYDHPYRKDICRTERQLESCAFSVFPVGERELFDIEVEELNHYITAGGLINKNCLDEASQFTEKQVRFLRGWVRTAKPGQRCRTLLATNPPLTADGAWIVKMFAPWLDPKHQHPAVSGELRWVIVDENDEDHWVEGPGSYDLGGGVIREAESRTYIPSSLDDNPAYDPKEYQKRLDALPAEVREILLGGFMTTFRDHPMQVIPTAWIQAAFARHKEGRPPGVPMTGIGVDPSGGGADDLAIAPRYDWWFAPIVTVPGHALDKLKLGREQAGYIVANRKDGARIGLDMGGGYGGGIYECLVDNVEEKAITGLKGAEKSVARTRDGKMGFFNQRAERYWKFREALDPDQEGGSPIALAEDLELLADLTALTYEVTPRGYKVTPKDSESDDTDCVRTRLGRSPNKGDAVVNAWAVGDRLVPKGQKYSRQQGGRIPGTNLGPRHRSVVRRS